MELLSHVLINHLREETQMINRGRWDSSIMFMINHLREETQMTNRGRWDSLVMFMSTHLREGNSDDKPATEMMIGYLAFACHQVYNHGGL